jgi:Phosphoribosylpyrophosphate synthetase
MANTLNLVYPEKSEIGYTIHNFPDGHKHIELHKGFNTCRYVNVVCRIRNMDDLFILFQVKDILEVNDISIEDLEIYYLFTARCDRRFSLGESLDLKIIANHLESLCIKGMIHTHDLHSDVLKRYLEYDNQSSLETFDIKKYHICFPDKGVRDRYNDLDHFYFNRSPIGEHLQKFPPILFDKVRVDKDTIKVVLISKINSSVKKKPILVVDDLIDGGGTFLRIAEELSKITSKKPNLFVTHAIQKEGLEKVAKVYDKVFITDSYKTWQNEDLPSNIIVRELYPKI